MEPSRASGKSKIYRDNYRTELTLIILCTEYGTYEYSSVLDRQYYTQYDRLTVIV